MKRHVLLFKLAHPDRFKLLYFIVVDNKLQEIRMLNTHFPEARVLICVFHVTKYLKFQSRKPEYGNGRLRTVPTPTTQFTV